MRLVRERPGREDARRYRVSRNNQALYRAASRLWQKGIRMSHAIQIVADAVAESNQE